MITGKQGEELALSIADGVYEVAEQTIGELAQTALISDQDFQEHVLSHPEGLVDTIGPIVAEAIRSSLRKRFFWHQETVRINADTDIEVIFLNVISDGRTGPGWIERLGGRDHDSKPAIDVLRSANFKPPSGVTYRIAIILGFSIPKCSRFISNITGLGNSQRWRFGSEIPLEVACLIQTKISEEVMAEMGLERIVLVHEAIDGRLLSVYMGRRLTMSLVHDNDKCGFAFVVSQSTN